MTKWLENAVFYEIYPQSFYDANSDGIGDFKGIEEKLDYIQSLGCNAIWMNPCYDSPFADAGYDVRDYKKTAARYGSNEELVHLFEEIHKRNMHIFLDLVPGHTSDEHEWFKRSSETSENEYYKRYVWTPFWIEYPDGLRGVAGKAERNGVYLVNFFVSQPALNYGFLNPDPKKPWQEPIDGEGPKATIEAIKDVMRFWLDLGCDGFRVDMADSLVKMDDENKSGTQAVWKQITSMLKSEYPDAAMVSEWNNPKQSLPAGFDLDFYLDWFGNGYNLLMRDDHTPGDTAIFCKNSKRSITDFLADYLDKYDSTKDLGRYCLITGNHDMTRAGHYLDTDELKLAYAFLITMPGNPFIYYGDEIGMRYLDLPTKEGGYTRTGSRTPMQWSKEANAGFSKASAEQLYLPVDASADAPNVEDQDKDEKSLLNTVRSLIALRQGSEDILTYNNLKFIYAKEDKRAFAYMRGNTLFAFNPDAKAQDISWEELGLDRITAPALYKLGDVSLDESAIHLQGVSMAVYKIK